MTGTVDNHRVWTIHSVAYDNTIQAGHRTDSVSVSHSRKREGPIHHFGKS